MKYTEGEWTVSQIGKGRWKRVFRVWANKVKCDCCKSTDQWMICDNLETSVGLLEAKANAQLISASPDLLEASIKARDKFEMLMGSVNWATSGFGSVFAEFEQLEKANKKATL